MIDVQAIIVHNLRDVEADLHKDATSEAKGCGWELGSLGNAKLAARKAIEEGARRYVNQHKPLRGVSAGVWGALIEGVDWKGVASALDLSDEEIERAWEEGKSDREEDDSDKAGDDDTDNEEG